MLVKRFFLCKSEFSGCIEGESYACYYHDPRPMCVSFHAEVMILCCRVYQQESFVHLFYLCSFYTGFPSQVKPLDKASMWRKRKRYKHYWQEIPVGANFLPPNGSRRKLLKICSFLSTKLHWNGSLTSGTPALWGTGVPRGPKPWDELFCLFRECISRLEEMKGLFLISGNWAYAELTNYHW